MSQSAQVNTSVTTASSSTVMVAHVVQRTNGANDDFDYDAPMSDAKMSHGDEAARPMFGAPISSLVTGAPAGNTMSSLSLAERLTQSLGTFGQTMTQRTQHQGQRMPSVVPIPPIAMPMMRPGVNTDSASQMLSQVLNPMHSTQMHAPHSLQNILAGNPTPIPIPGESRNMVLPPMHMPPQPFQVPGQPPQYSINDLPAHLQPQIQQLFAESPKLTEVDRYTIVKFLSQKGTFLTISHFAPTRNFTCLVGPLYKPKRHTLSVSAKRIGLFQLVAQPLKIWVACTGVVFCIIARFFFLIRSDTFPQKQPVTRVLRRSEHFYVTKLSSARSWSSLFLRSTTAQELGAN